LSHRLVPTMAAIRIQGSAFMLEGVYASAIRS
jgi:hypothetical protein